MIRLGYARQSKPSALRIAEASDGQIEAVRSSRCDINWGRSSASLSALNADISGSTNKFDMRTAFEWNDVPAPTLFDEREARSALADGITLLGRPNRHTRRRGFWVIDSIEQLDEAMTADRYAATHFMEYMDGMPEFRVHIFRDKSIRISEKRPSTARRCGYVTVKPTLERKRHLRAAAKAAVTAAGLDFGVVDAFADDEEVFVLEVNAAPGLGGTTPQLWAETFINYWEEKEVEADATTSVCA